MRVHGPSCSIEADGHGILSDETNTIIRPALPEKTVPTLRVLPQPMRQQVEEQLRKAIMAGVFPPGSHLSDRVLCEQFAVSPTIIRQPLRLLKADALVNLSPYPAPF